MARRSRMRSSTFSGWLRDIPLLCITLYRSCVLHYTARIIPFLCITLYRSYYTALVYYTLVLSCRSDLRIVCVSYLSSILYLCFQTSMRVLPLL